MKLPMRSPLYSLIALLLLSLRSGAVSPDQLSDFSRYQVILDKKSFGTPPPVAVTPVVPPVINTGPSWINDYRMTMLITQNDGTFRVGLVNSKTNESLTFSSDKNRARGTDKLMLVSTDPAKKMATISKAGDVQTISLEDPSVAAPPAAPTKTPTIGRMPSRPGPPTVLSSGRPQRPAPPAPPQPQQERLSGAELEKHLQEYQMEVLRKNLPPLPVQLSPENDAKLVQEGVLPALEAEGQ